MDEKNTLDKVNEIGRAADYFFDKDMIFVALSPHLGNLMKILNRIEPVQVPLLFMQYEGVMKMMRMIEGSPEDQFTHTLKNLD